MKKTMYLALAVLFLWGVWFSTPLTALAAEGEPTIESVELTATKTLMEKYSGNYGADGTIFMYNIDTTEPQLVLTYSDNTTKVVEWNRSSDYFNAISFYIDQSSQLAVGNHTTDVVLYDYNDKEYTSTMNFTIEENPVESISVVANNSLREGIDGYYDNFYNEETGETEQAFYVYYSDADIEIIVNYKDGTSKTYSYRGAENEILETTGYEMSFYPSALNLGSNTVTAQYLGVETTFVVEMVENPYKSISLEATEDLIYNFGGMQQDGYYVYDLEDTAPKVTVTYNNNNTDIFTYEQCAERFGSSPQFKYGQSASNQFVIGENTQTVSFLGCECEFTFNIVETPVKSIDVKAPAMQECNTGYSLDSDATLITITYNDATKPSETYTLEKLNEDYCDEFSLSLNDGEKELTVGKHQGIVSFLGFTTTFEFEIVANPIKSVTAVSTEKLIENEDGTMNGEAEGEPYFHYDINSTHPDVTVTYFDGTVKTYSWSQMYELEYDWHLTSDQSPSNPFKVGKNTGYIYLNGVKGEFTFEIIESPIKNISLKATKDLIYNETGYLNIDYNGKEYFHYEVSKTLPEVTLNYKDGTSKVFSYSDFCNFTDYNCYFEAEQAAGEANRLKLGENTIKVYVGSFEYDFTFNIVMPETTIEKITVIPNGKLIENSHGYYETETLENGETAEFYVYYEYALKYDLIVKYSNGTTKTYENVGGFDEIDGATFYVSFDGYQYDKQYKVGKNIAKAEYKGKETTFEVEVVKNDLKAVEISGENEFIITTTTENGVKTTYIASNYYIMGEAENSFLVNMDTDKGVLELVINYSYNDDRTEFKNISIEMNSADGTLVKSNVLSSNRWLDMVSLTRGMPLHVGAFANSYSNKFFGCTFHEMSGTITGSDVDKALTLCTGYSYIDNYQNTGKDENGEYAILTLAEAEKLAKLYFSEGKLSIESSPLYNAPAKEIKVYFMDFYLGFDSNNIVKYVDGQFVITSRYADIHTGENVDIKIVVADTGYVEEIYAGNHVYTSEIIKQPTATEKGVKEYTCSCGDSYLADIDKLVGKVEENKNNSFSATITQTETENIVSEIEITKEEQEMLVTGLDLKIVLKVEELENKVDTKEKEQIIEFLRDKVAGEQKLGAFIDIQLVKQIGDYEKNIEKTNSKIYVSLLLPEALINTDKSLERIYKVARYHDGDVNNVTILDATYDESTRYLTFATDCFSTYAIVYSDVEASSGSVSGGVSGLPDSDGDDSKDDVPKAGVISTSALWLGAMAVSGLGALALSKKKKED